MGEIGWTTGTLAGIGIGCAGPVNPVVAMFMPLVSDLAKQATIAPSKLFVPLSYAAILGCLCTLIGTSTNLVVQGLLIEARRTDPRVPVLHAGGDRRTRGDRGPRVRASHLAVAAARASNLRRARGRSTRAHDRDAGAARQPHRGRTIEEAGLRHLSGLYLASGERATEVIVAVPPTHRLIGHDRLVFVGVVDSIVGLQRLSGPAASQRRDPRAVDAASESKPRVGGGARDEPARRPEHPRRALPHTLGRPQFRVERASSARRWRAGVKRESSASAFSKNARASEARRCRSRIRPRL